MENPWQEIKNVDYCIQLSDQEGFSMVMLEALACGIPMITTPVSGAIEIIKDGINGYIVPHDEDGIVKTLKKIANDTKSNITAEKCRNSILKYEKSNALSDFVIQLKKCICGVD